MNTHESLEVFSKEYDGESIVDAYRDFSEALQENFNPIFAAIPQDKHGFQKGTFTMTITWKNEGGI